MKINYAPPHSSPQVIPGARVRVYWSAEKRWYDMRCYSISELLLPLQADERVTAPVLIVNWQLFVLRLTVCRFAGSVATVAADGDVTINYDDGDTAIHVRFFQLWRWELEAEQARTTCLWGMIYVQHRRPVPLPKFTITVEYRSCSLTKTYKLRPPARPSQSL